MKRSNMLCFSFALALVGCLGQDVTENCKARCRSLKNCGLLPSTLGRDATKRRDALEDCEANCTVSEYGAYSPLLGCFPTGVEISTPATGEWCDECRALAGCIDARIGADGRGNSSVALQWCPQKEPSISALGECNEEPIGSCDDSAATLTSAVCGPIDVRIPVGMDEIQFIFQPDGAAVQLEGMDVLPVHMGPCTQIIASPPPTVTVPSDYYRAALILSGTTTGGGPACVKFYGDGFVARSAETVPVNVPVPLLSQGQMIDLAICEQLFCHDGSDNDHDGSTDCFDMECRSQCEIGGACGDGLDNDGDQLIDCSDPDCQLGSGLCGGDGESDSTDSGQTDSGSTDSGSTDSGSTTLGP